MRAVETCVCCLPLSFVRWWFLEAAFVFGVLLHVEPLSDRHEGSRKLCRAHLPKNLPRFCCHRDLHTRGDLRDFQGQVIHRELFVDVLRSMSRPHRAFDQRHDIVRDQGDAKAKQRRLRIAQRVHLTREIHRQMLKGGFDGPAVGVQGGDLCCGGIQHRQIGENMQLGFAVAGRSEQLDGDPADDERRACVRLS